MQTAPRSLTYLKVIAFFCVQTAVTLGTESLKIRPVVRSTVGQLSSVVNERCGNEPSLSLAQFAQRVRRKERRSNSVPTPAVAFVGFGVSVDLVVSLCLSLGVFLTVPSCGQLGTTGVRTRLLCFVGHLFSLRSQGIEKGRPRVGTPSSFRHHNNITGASWLSMTFSDILIGGDELNRLLLKPCRAGGEYGVSHNGEPQQFLPTSQSRGSASPEWFVIRCAPRT